MVRRFLPLALALICGIGWSQERRVVLVSVDGLRPDFYLDPGAHGVELPVLRGMMRDGVFAEGVEGTYPSVTYPSHTTMVTGATPSRHGIPNNYVFDPSGSFADWYWYADAIRVPALWDVASGTTAAIHWPVTVGADIDLNFPEFWVPGSDRSWRDVRREVVTPELFSALESRLGRLPEESVEDEELEELAFDIAELVLERHRPQLLLLHVFNTDTAQHRHGREHREVAAAFELVDRRLGRLRDRIAALGLEDETLFVVTGDHGFIQTHTRIALNVELARSGLLRLGEDGSVLEWSAMAWPSGGSAAIVVNEAAGSSVRERVDRVVEGLLSGPLRGYVRRVPRETLEELGAMRGAAVVLEAEEGFVFASALSGELLRPSEDLGYHGYLPTHPRMRTGFLMVGPGVRRGVLVPHMRQVDIAPTLSHWAGWSLPGTDGLALRGLFQDER